MTTYHKYECKVLALLIGKSMNGRFRFSIMNTIFDSKCSFSGYCDNRLSFNFPLPKLTIELEFKF